MVACSFFADGAKGDGAFVAIGGYAEPLPAACVDFADAAPKGVGAFWESGGYDDAFFLASVDLEAPNGAGDFVAMGG